MYSDIHPSSLSSALEIVQEQRSRDLALFRLIHVTSRVPRFPMNENTFNTYKNLLEAISMHVSVNFLFIVNGNSNATCTVLSNGQYTEFANRETAIQNIYGIIPQGHLSVRVN